MSNNSLVLSLYDESMVSKLSISAWDNFIDLRKINLWLENFNGQSSLTQEKEREYAGFLLTRFMFFSHKLTLQMMVSLYDIHYKKPKMNKIRKDNKDSRDLAFLRLKYNEALKETRFVSLGNPADSSAHLLYIFRQVNFLETQCFIDYRAICDKKIIFNNDVQKVKSLFFFDDIVGGGTQSLRLLTKALKSVVKYHSDGINFDLNFICLFASTQGIRHLREGLLDRYPELRINISFLFELDDTYSFCKEVSGALEEHSLINSRFLQGLNLEQKYEIYAMVRHYGCQLYPEFPVGYGDGGFMIGFSHNTPNNTLPIFWYSNPEIAWKAAFNRFDKRYAVRGGI